MKNYSNSYKPCSYKPSSHKPDGHKLQQQIAVEAARLINEEGLDNVHYARKKATQRLGITDEHVFPDNEEILTQIKVHQSLYHNTAQERVLTELRQTALNAMKLFSQFKAKLIGSVLSGHAHEQSSIDLLVMVDSAEEIAFFLMEHKIPYSLQEWKLFSAKHHYQQVPAYQFYAGNNKINLITLAERERKLSPLNPINWEPMQKASIKQLEALLCNTS